MSADAWILTLVLGPIGLLQLYIIIGLPIRMWHSRRHPPPPLIIDPTRYRLADDPRVPIEDVIRASEKAAVEGDDGWEIAMEWQWM